MDDSKVCRHCEKLKPFISFSRTGKNNNRRRVCNACIWNKKKAVNPEKIRAHKRGWRKRNPHSAIIEDCRASDRKHNRKYFDLDHEFVRELIAKGCEYCGESAIRMTLDRIDNEQGHLKTNVKPCCIRCNYIRGSMPFKAWEKLIPGIREARELKLFGLWRTEAFNKIT